MLPGSICSGSHSVTMFSSATMVTSARTAFTRLHLERDLKFRTSNLLSLAVSRAPATARRARRLLLRRPAIEDLRPHLAHRIAKAHPQQRLARILENVDHLALRVLEIDALAVGKKVIVRAVADGLGQPPSQLSLQKFHDA